MNAGERCIYFFRETGKISHVRKMSIATNTNATSGDDKITALCEAHLVLHPILLLLLLLTLLFLRFFH